MFEPHFITSATPLPLPISETFKNRISGRISQLIWPIWQDLEIRSGFQTCQIFARQLTHKKFTLVNHLKEHQRTHAGEASFSCSTCDKKYSLLWQEIFTAWWFEETYFDVLTLVNNHSAAKPTTINLHSLIISRNLMLLKNHSAA